mmetsp:Transcript_25682/g.38442  ORF Transcript_25682/g.38442 Transcript_25682/m.38442 type:complete len:103 (-) Transcript_25682:469-777(-)
MMIMIMMMMIVRYLQPSYLSSSVFPPRPFDDVAGTMMNKCLTMDGWMASEEECFGFILSLMIIMDESILQSWTVLEYGWFLLFDYKVMVEEEQDSTSIIMMQ